MQMNILISRLSALGDTVCSLPVATALKRTFPESRITWLIDPRFASVVNCCPDIDEVRPYEFSWRKRVFFQDRFDLALDLQGLLKSAWPIAWAKANRKLGYHWQREGSGLMTQRVIPDPSSNHVVDQYMDVARAAGALQERAVFCLVPKEQAVKSVKEKLASLGIAPPFAVLNPSAGWVTKRWSPDRFARLIDLMSEAGLQSVLIGSNSEGDRGNSSAVTQNCRTQVGDLTGQTSIDELIALVGLGRLHVGGDTGSSHLAAALGRPAIGLYSITNPVRSCPYGLRDYCHYDRESLNRIEPEDVYRTVCRAMETLP